MKTMRTRVVIAALGAIVLSASAVRAQSPLTITDISGSVRIQEGAPCGDPIDVTTPIQQGRMDIAPLITRDGVLFDLTRMDLFLTPFTVERNCLGIPVTAEFREFGIQHAGAVRFPGEETGPLESRLYRFRIPKEQFLIHESILDNNPVPQPESRYERPSEDVTGLISLDPRRKYVQLHVVISYEVRFRAGCEGGHCLINEKHKGTTTSDVLALIDAGPTPPTVTCTPVNPPGGSFRVFAEDDSDAAIIRLGEFVLANGEVIQLQQTGQPGVRLLETTRTSDIRHFQVGPGEAFITATDPSGNVGIAFCR